MKKIKGFIYFQFEYFQALKDYLVSKIKFNLNEYYYLDFE